MPTSTAMINQMYVNYTSLMDPMSLYNIESIHHGHHSIQIRNQIDSPLPILRPRAKRSLLTKPWSVASPLTGEKKKKHRHSMKKGYLSAEKSWNIKKNAVVWGTLVDMASFAAICFFTCCKSPLRHDRPGSSRLSSVCDRTDGRRKCRDEVIPFVQDGGPYYSLLLL